MNQTLRPDRAPDFHFATENLRGLSILFVMLSHISSYHALGPLGAYLSFFFGDATTWFVFISGYLFTRIEGQRFDYKRYLSKKVRFVLTPYLILSVPAIAAGLHFGRHHILGLDVATYIPWSILVGGSVIVPMWFIPMIVIFFLLSPLFHRIGSSSHKNALLAVSLGASLFTTRPVDNLNPLLQFLHFTGFYVLGISFAARDGMVGTIKSWPRGPTLTIWVALVLFAVSSAWFLFQGGERPLGFFDGLGQFNNSEFGKVTLFLALFFLFDRYLNSETAFLGRMAEISFGLFFIHGFYMAIFVKFLQILPELHQAAVFCIEVAMVVGGSFATVLFAKRVFGNRSRYVVGC